MSKDPIVDGASGGSSSWEEPVGGRTPREPVPATPPREPLAGRSDAADLESLFENAPVALCILDTDLRYRRVNRCMAEINGLPAEAHIGRTVREVVPDLADQAEAAMRAVLDTGVPVVDIEIGGETASRPGIERSWNESWLPLRLEDGSIAGLNVVAYETTEQRLAEQGLRELTESLELQVAERNALAELRARQLQALAVEVIEAEEQERARVADLLHDDLQQLLAGARLRLGAAARSPALAPELAAVDELLAEALATSRKLSHHLSPAVLHHAGLRAALQWLARDMAEQLGLEVSLELEEIRDLESSPLKTFLFRAVQELLFNVVKHAGVPRARVVVSRTDGHVTVAVSDEGRGFDFEAVESSGVPDGFGLLKLRERALVIGGRLEVESGPGRGSRVTVTVPADLAASEDADEAAVGSSRQPGAAEAGGSDAENHSLRLLIADDHRVVREGLIGMFDDQPGLSIVGEAADGREAVELSRQLRPDVVLMDVSMPEMDGIEATRRIKSEHPELRVIGLSMHDDDG
ncbi:MAG TPA: response regulator, partial [Chondromyces sp.]|nr:response regulator [Chondromyces sp.]